MYTLLYLAFMAVCNRARGTRFWNHLDSTVVARLLATFLMSVASALWLGHDLYVFLWSWAALMVWCTPAWDRYWEACIAGPVNSQHGWPPVDYIMAKYFPPLPANDCPYMRFWGIVAMGLRQALAMPWVLGLAYFTHDFTHVYVMFLTLLFGVPYYIGGLLFPGNPKAVGTGEVTVGALLGVMCVAI